MITIPESFSQRVINVYGDKGKIWLASLNDKIAWSEGRWKIEVQQPFKLSFNYVASVIFHDQTDGVLKVCIPNKECDNEINVLKFYSGAGICRLIDSERDLGILLLERLNPGNNLKTIVQEVESVKIAASLIRVMKSKIDSTLYSFPAVCDLASGIKKLRAYFKGGSGPFAESVVQKVESLLPELISSQTEAYILHGDLHHENILQTENEWKLIDPKGVIGEMEYEIIPFLSNNLSIGSFEQLIENRIALFKTELNINIEKANAWGLCYSLLSAWWNIEDNLGISGRDMALIEHFNKKVS